MLQETNNYNYKLNNYGYTHNTSVYIIWLNTGIVY